MKAIPEEKPVELR